MVKSRKIVFILLQVFFLFSLTAWADDPGPETRTIGRIITVGNYRITDTEVLAKIRSRVGDVFEWAGLEVRVILSTSSLHFASRKIPVEFHSISGALVKGLVDLPELGRKVQPVKTPDAVSWLVELGRKVQPE